MNNPNILVPTDFSELSRRALRAANQWVRKFGGKITPMHAYESITDLDGFHFYGPEESVAGDLKTVERAVRRLMDETLVRMWIHHIFETAFLLWEMPPTTSQRHRSIMI